MVFDTASILCLLGSSACFTSLFVANKFYQKSVKSSLRTAFVFSFLNGLIISTVFLIGCCIYGFYFNCASFWNAVGVAAMMVITQCCGVLALSLGNVSVYSQAFLLGGMLLPWFYGVFFENGAHGPHNIATVILMIIAVILPIFDGISVKKKEQGSKKKTWLFYLLCLLVLLSNGTTCVLNSINTKNEATNLTTYCSLYGVFIMLFSCFGLLFAYLHKRKETKEDVLQVAKPKPLLFASLYALSYAFGSLLTMLGVTKINPGIFYPVSNSIVIVLTYILGILFFKEKPRLFSLISLGLTILSAIMFLF